MEKLGHLLEPTISTAPGAWTGKNPVQGARNREGEAGLRTIRRIPFGSSKGEIYERKSEGNDFVVLLLKPSCDQFVQWLLQGFCTGLCTVCMEFAYVGVPTLVWSC